MMAKKTTSKTSKNKMLSYRRTAGQGNTSKPSARSSTCVAEAPMLTHDQIAERAKKIWQDQGCPPGFDEQNWHKAETQLKTELEVH